MPRKPLTERRDPTLPAAGVGWFLTRPGCPTASAGFGAAPQGPGTARSGPRTTLLEAAVSAKDQHDDNRLRGRHPASLCRNGAAHFTLGALGWKTMCPP
jgi:hypothetical protein